MTKGTQARLRLIKSDDFDLCSSYSFNAASPLGTAVRPCSMSLTDEGARPMTAPISASVIPVDRRSATRDAHVLMRYSLRDPVDRTQRLPVTGTRDTLFMANRPADLPRFDLLGDRIVYWRGRRRMTRSQLARLSKIPYSTLAEIESNEQKSTTKITQIAAALTVNAHYLATDKGNPEDLTSSAPESDGADWPFPIDRSELMDLDEVEIELVGLKLQKIIAEIRAKRPRHRARKVS